MLTTREYILAEALQRYERLSNIEVELYKSTVSLGDYTSLLRARILYNHLFFSELSLELKRALIPKARYWDVIRHRNYNPRVIDHAISVPSVAELTPDRFVSTMMETLDNPASVWGRVFDNLPAMARRILMAVASLPARVLVEDLQAAVRGLSPIGFEPGEFKSALSMVEGTFLEIDEARPGTGRPERIASIRDPSVLDYLWTRLEVVDGEAALLLENAVFFDQCSALYSGHRHATRTSKGRRRNVVDPEAVASRALALIRSRNPQLTPVLVAGRTYFNRDKPSPELRAAFLANVLAEHQASETLAVAVESALGSARAEWESGRGSARDGIYLLTRANQVGSLLSEDALELAGQAFLDLIPRWLDQVEGFTTLVELADLRPQLFTAPNRDLESWAREFQDFLQVESNWLLHELDDPDWIEENLDAISRIAEMLGVDVDELRVAVERRMFELREDPAYGDSDDEWRPSDSGPQTASNVAEVDALFQSLMSMG